MKYGAKYLDPVSPYRQTLLKAITAIKVKITPLTLKYPEVPQERLTIGS